MKLLFASVTFSLLSGISCSGPPPKPASANSQVRATASPPLEQPNQQQQTAGLAPPEVVRSEEVRIESGLKMLTVGNSQGRYHLWCSTKADSCITPIPGKDYLVFSKTTRWQFPRAKECCATLKLFQDFSLTYNNQENIALVPADDDEVFFGMYALASWEKNP